MNACNPKEYMIPGFDLRQAELTTRRQPTPLLLAPVGDKTVELDFDGGRLSSDAGLVLLKDIDDQLGLTRALAAVLADSRDARRIQFTPEDLLKQRIFQIAAGYEDANDANTLRHDPIFKLLLDRLPETGAPLASQPTISRFENSVSRTAIYRMALVVSANLLHGFEQFNLQNTVRNAFPLTCPSGYVLMPPLLCYVDSAVEGGIYAPRISQCAATRSLHQ